MNNKQFLIIIVVTFIVIIIWIITDIVHTRPSVEINPKLSTLLSPLNPSFDPKIIDQIKEVTPVTDLQIENKKTSRFSTASNSAQPAVNPNATPLPFPSDQIPRLNASTSATLGGNL
jgi:hypothetical protein